MRLLHVVPSYLPATRYGGPIVTVHRLASALAERGHEVHVATTDVDGPGTSGVPTDRPVTLDGVTVHYFAAGWPRRLYRSPAMGRWLARAVPDFDLVHLHALWLWPTAAGAAAARRHRIPYLLAPRGMLVPELIRRRSHLAKTLWLAAVERRNLAGAAGLHVTSALEGQDARRVGIALPPLVEVPNGVDPPPAVPGAMSPAVRATIAAGPFVLFLGRLSWKKGLDLLLPAIARLPTVRLVVAGPDDEGYGATVRALVATHRLAERVTLLGPVSATDRWHLLAACRALAAPSYSENFANVVAEAMVAGRAVVVTPGVGLAALVERAGAGVVCATDGAAVAAALGAVLADPEAARAMGERGRAAALASLAWPAVAARMETAYRAVTGERAGAPTLAG